MKKINRNSPEKDLEAVKEGDEIKDDTGKQGEVSDIEVVTRKKEKQYYYKLKNDGTILVIK